MPIITVIPPSGRLLLTDLSTSALLPSLFPLAPLWGQTLSRDVPTASPIPSPWPQHCSCLSCALRTGRPCFAMDVTCPASIPTDYPHSAPVSAAYRDLPLHMQLGVVGSSQSHPKRRFLFLISLLFPEEAEREAFVLSS